MDKSNKRGRIFINLGLAILIIVFFNSNALLFGQDNSITLNARKFSQNDGLDLSSFTSIFRDSSDILWVLGLEKHPVNGEIKPGLSSYDGERFIHHHLPHNIGNIELDPTAIYPWNNKKILVQSDVPGQLFTYSPVSRKLNYLTSEEDKIKTLNDGIIYNNDFYGFATYEDQSHSIVILEDDHLKPLFSSDLLVDVIAIYPDENGIWVCTFSKVFYFDIQGKLIYNIDLDNQEQDLYVHANTIRGIEIFIQNKEPIVIEKQSGKISTLPFSGFLGEGRIYRIEVDNKGNTIYVFNDPYLLDKIFLVSSNGVVNDLSEIKNEVTDIVRIVGDDFRKSFELVSTIDIVEFTLQQNYITQHLINAELRKIKLFGDYLYVATESGGIYRSENKPDLDFKFVSSERNPRLLEKSDDGNFYTNDIGLFYKKTGDEVRIFDNEIAAFDAIFLNDTLMVIVGSSRISFAHKDHWSMWPYEERTFKFMHKLLRINDAEFFIASHDGLFKMNIANNTFTDIFTSESVLCVTEESDGVWWFGTSNGQLINLIQDSSGYVTTKVADVGSTIATITKDNRERLWIGTFNGIFVYDETSEQMFKIDDQLISHTECNRLSSFFNEEFGQMFIGTVHGLNVFDVDKIDFGQSNYSLSLSYLQYYNSRKKQNDSLFLNGMDQYKVKLDAYHRYLDIGFGPGISSGKNHEYYYALTPLSNSNKNVLNWVNNGNNAQVSLSNITSGKYNLLIKSRDRGTGQESNMLNVEVIVSDFFYNQWWFYSLIFAAVSLGFFFWRERLKNENIRLEKEVEKRTDELKKDKEIIQKQAEELRVLDKAKSTFYNNISHELKTPLTLISGPLESIKDGAYFKDDKANKLINLIDKNVSHLTGRVEELLEINRLENKKVGVHNSPVKISEFVQNHVEIFGDLAAEKDIELNIKNQNASESVNVDERMLGKVIQNLISNSIKYCPEGSRIVTSIFLVEQELHLIVEDNGNGIPSKYQHLVFDKFYQLPSNEKVGSGSGIGLSIVKEYVELMGGTIRLESDEGQGTSFEITLPTKVISEIDDHEVLNDGFPIVQLPSQKTQHILIVEDNEDLRSFLSITLSDYFHLYLAKNGVEALDHLKNYPEIDLILSDIMMPEMDGMQLLEEVKADQKLRRLPFIFLTAKQNEFSKFSALRLGVDDYLTKPFSKNELLLRIMRLLKNAEIRKMPISESDEEYVEEDSKLYDQLEKFVLASLTDPTFSVESIASELGMSNRSLRRYLQKEIGMSPNEFIMEVRMNLLRDLRYKDKDISLKELANKVGYMDHKYMSRLFFERFGYRL